MAGIFGEVFVFVSVFPRKQIQENFGKNSEQNPEKDSRERKKAHEHKSFWPVTVRGRGLPVGCPGVKDLCAIFGTQGT